MSKRQPTTTAESQACPASGSPRRMPSSQTEAWGRICLAMESMADNSREMLETLKKIETNTSDMADELSEMKVHITSPDGA